MREFNYCKHLLNYKMAYFVQYINILDGVKFLTILDSVADFGMSVHFRLLGESSEEGDNGA